MRPLVGVRPVRRAVPPSPNRRSHPIPRPRHLERRFLDVVGISPKRLSRITRFQAALQALQTAGQDGTGAATAAAFGYADQPHFIREFRELAGCTPSAHLLQQAALTGFFITGSRSSIP